MKIKSYYSRTVEDAIAAARQEMGPDAMLVNSRKAPPEARHLGEYEVVFGVVGAATAAEVPGKLPGESYQPIAQAAPVAGDRLSVEVAELKKELEGMRRDHDHFKSTLELKDKQIGFLEGHVSQLTQSISQLALKPGDEEIKKKGWWQFWRG